jgi:hypothetical protein
VAKFYTSATTTTKKANAKGTKEFFGGKKKAPKSPYFERKKRFEIAILRQYIPPMGHQNKLGFFFLFY